jgi:hypothetical protein
MTRRNFFIALRNNILAAVGLLMLLSLGGLRVQAQTTGKIYGQVTDPAGASIPGATVTATSLETNLARTVTTDSEGSYSFTLVPPGKYELKAEATGFKPFHQTGLEIQVQANVRVDFKMEVGSVSESVVVTSEPPQVDTTSPTLGKVVEQRRITALPLNGRNFLQLAVLQPGVVPAVPGISFSQSGTNSSPGGTKYLFAVNGLRVTSNNFLLDGANNTDPVISGAIIVPSADAIQEFKILTNMYSAEFGRAGGSIVTILTKSGSNHFHGSLYEFFRNDVFDARNFFAPKVPELRQNEFGFTIGGPVMLPRFGEGGSPISYNGRDRTFFFFSYEGFRRRAGVATSTPVPSSRLRAGDFSLDPRKPIDPTTGQPFPLNVIPDIRISSISKQLLTLYPPANTGDTLFSGAPAQSYDRNQILARVDHQFHAGKDNLTGRYARETGDLVSPVGASANFSALTQIPGFPFEDGNRSQNVMLAETHSFSANLINDVRLSYDRLVVKAGEPVNHLNPLAFGFTFPMQVPDLPAIAIPGFSSLAQNTFADRIMNIFNIQDSLSIKMARHSIKTGVEYRHTQVKNLAPGQANGAFNFTGGITGNPFADFLLGLPDAFVQAGGKIDKYLRQNAYYFYGQDEFRATKKLTLSLGLRYELIEPFTENDDLIITFKPGVQSVRSPTMPVGILRPGDPGVPKTLVPIDKNNFAPRFGLAWDPRGNGKTSVRAGYGIFYDESVFVQTFAIQQPPDVQFRQIITNPPSFADPFLGHSPLLNLKFPLPVPPGTAVLLLAPDIPVPYVQQWNLTVQRQLSKDLMVEAAYVGTKGTHLSGDVPINQAIWNPGATQGNVQSRRPFQPWGQLFLIENVFNSNYHGLQLSLNKRYSKGLTFEGSYTWSKAIDQITNLNFSFRIPGQASRPQDSYNLAAERGLSPFDLRHRFVASYVWELPILKNRGDLWGKAFGGWRTSGIVTLQSGTPFTIIDSFNPSLDGESGDRVNLVGNPNLPGDQRTVARWFNTAAFQRFSPPNFGNAGRDIVFSDGVKNFDMTLMKNFALGEDKTIEFRWEVFNVFNHPNFAIPVNDFNSASFGKVLSTSTPERQMQFALKFLF